MGPEQRQSDYPRRSLPRAVPQPAHPITPQTAQRREGQKGVTMRKTGLTRSRSRRKATQNGPGTPGTPNDANVSPPPPSAGAPAPASVATNDQPRRKPTQEEAALTAKNYRLAKELSELRVRHRDETKAVTRLTMENMNLASRCREALSHVAMLKKELAMHQRRAAEALALQRQQSQRMSEHGDETASNLDRDRTVPAASYPPPQPLMKESLSQPAKHPPQTPQDNQYSSVLYGEQGSASALGHTEHSTATKPAANAEGDSRTLPVSQRPDFDAVSHDLGMTRKPAVMSSVSLKPGPLMDEVPADELLTDRDSSESGRDSLDLFSGKSALPVTPEKETLEDDSTPSFSSLGGLGRQSQPQTGGKDGDSSEKKSKSSRLRTAKVSKNQKGPSTMSSIDAFEASFDTTFPVSFSTPSEEPPPSLDIAFDVPEFSDPFFLGSHDGGEGSSSSPFVQSSPLSTPAGKQSIFDREPVGDGEGLPRISTGEAAENVGYQGNNSALVSSAAATGDDTGTAGKLPSFDLFPSSAMSTFEQHVSNTPTQKGDHSSKTLEGYSGDVFFRTPPVYLDSFADTSVQEVPPPPREKAGAAEARARYDAALGENAPAKEKVDQENQQRQVKAAKDANVGGVAKSESSHTPSLVLKRLQQRRAREKGASIPSTPPTKASSDTADAKIENRKSSRRSLDGDSVSNSQRTALANGDYGPKIKRSNSNSSAGGDASKGKGGAPGKLSPDAMGEEMRQLDAIATASSGQLSEPSSVPSNQSTEEPPGGRRRNVKQPVSYAEPALNKKLRRGDVYFPKKDNSKAELMTEEENGVIQVISPSSGPEPVDEIDLNPLQTTSTEDVLKDLAENTSALKI